MLWRWIEHLAILSSLSVVDYEVDGVNHTWDVAKECEEDIDQEICAAASLQKHCNGWEEDGNDDLADF